jgi:hypothetical protein
MHTNHCVVFSGIETLPESSGTSPVTPTPGDGLGTDSLPHRFTGE